MAKSLRATPGKKQTYNLYDSSDLQRALKAINERISDIERTWGQDSQIYRDYTAPLRVLSIQDHIRIDSKGRIKFKTGQGQNVEEVRTSVTKMLSKKTKGDIIESTRQQLKIGKTVNEKNFMKGEQIKQLAEEYKIIYSELDSLIREIYELVGKEGLYDVCREMDVEYVLEGHWDSLTYDELKTAIDELVKWVKSYTQNDIFGGKSTL